MSIARKDTYKTPPTAITDKFASQQARRKKVLLDITHSVHRVSLRFQGSRRTETCAQSQIPPLTKM